MSAIVLFMNFVIINFLEWTTNSIEKHETKTKIKLSLMKKIIFFMFVNISIMPFLIFLYGQIDNEVHVEAPL